MSNLLNEAEPLLHSPSDDEYSQTDPAKATRDRYRALARFAGCCISALSTGWHDGCIGALIPYLQLYYGISDEKVSLVFIGSFTGYILASLLNVTLNNRLGVGRLILLGAGLQGLASAITACRPPFIAIAISYALAGFGVANQDAQFNTYVARLPGAATKLGVMHAIYGVGALSSPILATLLMQARIVPPLFYLTNVAWCAVTITVLLVGFEFRGSNPSPELSQTAEREQRVAPLKTVLSSRAVWPMLLFVVLYTGTETTESGWVVSFLMRVRNGGVMSGYASAAFYAGLTSSRVVLLPLTAWITEKRAVTLYSLIAIATQVVVWTSPLFLVDFIAVAACGFVMGPVYPITVSLVTKATPREYHPGALSLMACFGMSGSAIFPFVVGSLADRYSIRVLQPVLVSLFTTMMLVWQLVPSPRAALRRSLLGSKPASVDGSENSASVGSSI
ncbi:Bypass of stop codon 6 [Hyphodiscus hymeniophilus]|uniref:Bypass of stop codon 6 n=1 Tax=Hyphodiscus hymeniophilus TaxID=353542 RepID=A0A9P6SPF0_9HELO|nr:Bypass of stop codon 6 [Hyphodiscus hymeniophilus]